MLGGRHSGLRTVYVWETEVQGVMIAALNSAYYEKLKASNPLCSSLYEDQNLKARSLTVPAR